MAKLHKEEFLKSEFGSDCFNCLRAIDHYLYHIDIAPKNDRSVFKMQEDIASIIKDLKIYEAAINHFYGIEYKYFCNADYIGLYSDMPDGSVDYLIKNERKFS